MKHLTSIIMVFTKLVKGHLKMQNRLLKGF
jgi:hypothetical protein